MLSASRVVVTGAGGFLGSAVLRALVAAPSHPSVHAIVSAPGATFVAAPAGVETSQCDIDDVDALAARFVGASLVLHVAGPSSVAASFERPTLFARAHALGTAAVVEAAARCDVAALVHVSSAEVYGQPQEPVVREDHPMQPRSPYGASKAAAEMLVQSARHYRGRVAIVRPFSVYGPGQPAASLLSAILRQALDASATEVVLADLRPVRDYCYVDDVAAAVLRAALPTDDAGPRVYNVASGEGVAVGALAALAVAVAAERTGRALPVREDASRRRPGGADILHMIADTSRAAHALAWRPQISLREGLARTVATLLGTPP